MRHAPLGRMWFACAIAVVVVLAGAPSALARTLQRGSRGHDVRLLQSELNRLGYRTAVDGIFGRGTQRSVRSFERHERLTVDGIAGPAVQRRLRQRLHIRTSNPPHQSTQRATLSSDGRTAQAPQGAPPEVQEVIAAANRITRKPYRYGGGHGRWNDSGYDCSGAVSYALHGADLVTRPLDSTGFESWGRRGRGRWITVYANSGHAYLIVAGLRFDTSGTGGSGPRWRPQRRSSRGYVARHPAGL